MRITPNLKAVRFQQLEPGDLFIFASNEFRCMALRGVDPELHGDVIALLLGPGLATNNQMRVLKPGHQAVIAIGKDYVLRLPVAPAGWAADLPPNDTSCLAVTDGRAFFRGNFGGTGENFRPCWIEAATGTLRYQPPPGIAAYAIQWEIVIEDAALNENQAIAMP